MPAYTLSGELAWKLKSGRRVGVTRCRRFVWEGVTEDSFASSFGDVTCPGCFRGSPHRTRYRIDEARTLRAAA